jgi:uncharacterized protein (DUF4415 family)
MSFILFPHGRQAVRKRRITVKTSVKFSELKDLPSLSKKRIAEIKAFAGGNFQNNPEWSAEDWKKARPAYVKIPRADIHTKIDADLLDWLKSGGKSYQARLNAALRFAMNNKF